MLSYNQYNLHNSYEPHKIIKLIIYMIYINYISYIKYNLEAPLLKTINLETGRPNTQNIHTRLVSRLHVVDFK